MMITHLILSTVLVYFPSAPKGVETQVLLEIRHADFCYYVEIFSQQVARNKIRNVPFSRLNEFSYFNDAYSKFLEETALGIYERRNVNASSLATIAAEYRDLCERSF